MGRHRLGIRFNCRIGNCSRPDGNGPFHYSGWNECNRNFITAVSEQKSYRHWVEHKLLRPIYPEKHKINTKQVILVYFLVKLGWKSIGRTLRNRVGSVLLGCSPRPLGTEQNTQALSSICYSRMKWFRPEIGDLSAERAEERSVKRHTGIPGQWQPVAMEDAETGDASSYSFATLSGVGRTCSLVPCKRKPWGSVSAGGRPVGPGSYWHG